MNNFPKMKAFQEVHEFEQEILDFMNKNWTGDGPRNSDKLRSDWLRGLNKAMKLAHGVLGNRIECQGPHA
jgi:hypothetical protein